MKIIYIAGLEHSGTTLTEQLLCSHAGVLGLGEVASFFSPRHMQNYMQRWDSYPDARLCSCRKEWEDCPFWGPLVHLSGLHSDRPFGSKYLELLSSVEQRYGKDIVLTDSSKRIDARDHLRGAFLHMGGKPQDFLTVLTIKDVRSFSSSMGRKTGKKSFLDRYQAMNYWRGSNQSFLSEMETKSTGTKTIINLYEHLCLDPLAQTNSVLQSLCLPSLSTLDLARAESHIAMGNKDFLMRNRQHVKYDQRWFLEDGIHWTYLFNHGARSLNKEIYRLSQIQDDD